MSSCCGGGSPKGKRGEEEKAQAIRNPESTPEHEGHDHAGCGMEGGLMKWLLLGLLIYLAVSYVRSAGLFL